MSNPFTNALGSVLQESRSKAVALVEQSIEDLVIVGGEAAKRATLISEEMTQALADIAAGRMDYEDGKLALERHVEALGFLADGVKEAAAKTAIRRARQALAIAGEAALLGAQVLAKVAIGALLV